MRASILTPLIDPLHLEEQRVPHLIATEARAGHGKMAHLGVAVGKGSLLADPGHGEGTRLGASGERAGGIAGEMACICKGKGLRFSNCLEEEAHCAARPQAGFVPCSSVGEN